MTTQKHWVRVSDENHPHAHKIGYLTGKVISLFGKPMAEVKFDREDGGCFAEAHQLTKIKEPG